MTPLAAVLLAVLVTQASTAPTISGGPGPAPNATTTAAVRAARAPVIDGLDDDEIWRVAPAITAFREFQPTEDKDPRFATEAKVAYDAHNLYVFIRAFDPHPDSILRLLGRRDFRTASDQLKIMVDSYHDRRSGYEFAVNPAGVKRDYAMYNDGDEDDAWDAVWDVGTQVDSLGWTAEFRVPLSQLRYTPGTSNTFGFAVWRDVQRYTERVSWPLFRPSQAGIVSQLGTLTGLDGLAAPNRLELMPYAVARNLPVTTTTAYARDQQVTAGADIKYGLTSSLTIDATVNPDFGQVEADPSVLNLGAFETFFQERRPFFVAGSGIFSFGVNCSQVNCNGENLFYSRRVGADTKILGAAKLTGRSPRGLTLGFLDAVTERRAPALEPTTNYSVLRAQQDFRRGESGIGLMLTAVNRSLDALNEDFLRRSAYVGAVDFRHRFAGGRYQISGSLDASRVAGTAAAIGATQQSAVHNYQRPDDGLAYDSTRTALGGDAEELYFSKLGGGLIRFETSYQRRSPGFEANDMGFLLRANQQSWNNWMGLQFTRPAWIYQRASWNFNWWQFWTTAGKLPQERAANTNVHAQLNNRWWVHAGGTLGNLGGTFCDHCARGGPAVRVDPYLSAWSGIQGDDRRVLIPSLWLNYWQGDGGRSHFANLNPQLSMRVSSRFNASLGFSISWNRDDWQFVGKDTTGGTTHYTFAHLEQRTTSLSGRMDYTLSPNLTIQLYGSPFVSRGEYSNVRELANPRAEDYASRFQPFGTPGATSGFNFKQFRSNLVLRWEYRPGSTLFVVWGEGRDAFDQAPGNRSVMGDFRDLFDAHPDNTFLIKASYWLNW